MGSRGHLVLALVLVAAVAGAGCLDQVRDTVGAEPSHTWATKATLQESVSASESLAAGTLPSETHDTSFSLPMDTTDLRMTVNVDVGQAGNVTVDLRNPSETVYSKAFGSSTEDTFQTQNPTTGEWALESVLRGEADIDVRVDARVPVD